MSRIIKHRVSLAELPASGLRLSIATDQSLLASEDEARSRLPLDVAILKGALGNASGEVRKATSSTECGGVLSENTSKVILPYSTNLSVRIRQTVPRWHQSAAEMRKHSLLEGSLSRVSAQTHHHG